MLKKVLGGLVDDYEQIQGADDNFLEFILAAAEYGVPNTEGTFL